ncbi:(2Fe-2S)-binding protein [Candidatus Puniceispirillum sp.]|jgi:carbon-monoxide dehydrogenase small subunit|nr:(2Fe-2S)-binding protein [Candidatus Puniceispirillum sp.]
MIQVSIEVNGKTVTAEVEPRLTLLDFIRDVAGLKGTHAGCEHGVCGACTVLVEGNAIRSCLVLAVQADEQEVISIEGVGGDLGRSGELSIVQDAFCEAHGLQCGYCTPGMVLAAEALLADTPNPTEGDVREAISGNICRCTGYVQIVEAVMLAADRLASRNYKSTPGQNSDQTLS